MVCCIHQPPSPTMRRRLAASAEHGWLLRLHGSDCRHLVGTVARLAPGMHACALENPGTLAPMREVALDEVCDVEVVTAAFIVDGVLAGRLAVIAPWRGGPAGPGLLLGDLTAGDLAAGQRGLLLLPDGVRRHGTVTERRGRRCRVALDPPHQR